MTTYEKINTLWQRDKDNKFVIMPGFYSCQEFANVNLWEVTEKIDGMNTRVIITKDDIEFRGRTDRAQLPAELMGRLSELFLSREKIDEVFDFEKANEVVLYGEGYGPKIQKGGIYRDDQDFILFDIMIDDIWFEGRQVTYYADLLGLNRVPVLGIMNTPDIVDSLSKSPVYSRASIRDDAPIEGVVCRSFPLMLNRLGKRVIFKLKVKDYEQLERIKEG